MSSDDIITQLPVCISCRRSFNTTDRYPYTHSCQHSVCRDCIRINKNDEPLKCPAHDTVTKIHPNLLLARIVGHFTDGGQPDASIESIDPVHDAISIQMHQLTTLLEEDLITDNMSPQIKRKLLHVIEASPIDPEGRLEFMRRINSLFRRLLLELIQAHKSTKHRESEFYRLLKDKGCAVEPKLTDLVIHLLVKLFKAAAQCEDKSFERKVINEFLFKELEIDDPSHRRLVEKIVQTLFRASCFRSIQKVGASGRLELKSELFNVTDLRRQHDLELMRLAREHNIRLAPDSWAFLLYGQTNPDYVAKVQSLLDRCQNTDTSVSELELAIDKSQDKFRLKSIFNNLRHMEKDLNSLTEQIDIPLMMIEDCIRFFNMHHYLLRFRKYRRVPLEQGVSC